MNAAILVATMALVTMALRFLPFILLRGEVSPYLSYLGRVLPPAGIGMLVVYCLKDINPMAAPYGLPELIATAIVIAMQAWRRNSILSILAGTIAYMILIRLHLFTI